MYTKKFNSQQFFHCSVVTEKFSLDFLAAHQNFFHCVSDPAEKGNDDGKTSLRKHSNFSLNYKAESQIVY